ncbi:alpha-2-macroglobulin family protein [Plastorhodobacter daqingensis]|uniref:Alpha-2-macroglobulin family protein n=1 Tax=Plastorhodobacter daqingensis TaxID=1387281 RepID=A0ABW2US91_9RHOB
MRNILLAVLLLGATPLLAQEGPVPERRLVVTEDVDFYGGDLSPMFNTTLEACQRACLATEACQALTFNSRSGACFPKSGVAEERPFAGAISARVRNAAAGVLAGVAARQAELSFLDPGFAGRARDQALSLAGAHPADGRSAAELRQAADAAAQGDPRAASRLMGQAVVLEDLPEDWTRYARLLFAIPAPEFDERMMLLDAAELAAVNAILRASDGAETRAGAFLALADVLESRGNGRAFLAALRRAAELAPTPELAARIEAAELQFGFRIIEHVVESDLARPRVCAQFSEDLAVGVDYASFVQGAATLTVEPDGSRLCLEGVEHGQNYQVTFRRGLPSAAGESLPAAVPVEFYVRDRAPAVRFPGRAYVLPRGNGIALPVETVNTAAVDLVLRRVSDRNLLGAIQNNWFGRSLDPWQDQSFAETMTEDVWQGQAEVAQDLNRDVTTSLPLSESLGDLPPGIYVLRAAVAGTEAYDIAEASQWFVVSDLGLTSLSGTDGLHVWVRSLGSAGPRPGVQVSLVSRSNRVLETLETDADGHGVFAAGLARGTGGAAPALITAEEEGVDIAFLPLTDPEFDLSDRGAEGREPAPPVDVFLTTDRGAYRAGETIFATALARDGLVRALPGLPLTARLVRPDGVEYARQLSANDHAGGHVFAFPLAPEVPRGQWRLEIRADPDAPALRAATVLVEDFLPERIDFQLDLQDPPQLDRAATLGIEARYLFGAPGADLAIEGELALHAADGLAAFPGYRFGLQDDPFLPVMTALPPGLRTDAEGRAQIVAPLPEATDPGRPLEVRATVRLSEGSNRPVERRLTAPVLGTRAMIGLQPLFDDVAAEGTEAGFRLIALDADGTRRAMTVRWTLSRIETRYQWYQMWGQWNWDAVVTRSRVAEGVAEIGDAGPASLAIPVTWGEYELRAEEAGGAAVSALRFHAGWYAPADTTETPDTLQMSLDRPLYAPGDVARLRLVARADGTALVSVLSDRVIDRQVVQVKAGETLIPLNVTEDWGAGAYVTASVLHPMDAATGRNPARALGLVHAAVDPGPRRLAARFDVPAEAAPRTPLEIVLEVDGLEPGDAAHATIAAVDLGILNLTGFQAPDPDGHYFGQRKLGVGIRDLYGRLIDGMAGVPGRLRSGGDAGSARLQAPPPTEELVAWFDGPLRVDADGRVRAEVPLPPFNGTVRLMAVVWSDRAVGQAEADVVVRDPVVVQATLPRFLAPGDSGRLLLDLSHLSGPAGEMALEILATGLEIGAHPDRITLAEGAAARVAVRLAAPEAGVYEVEIALTPPDGERLTQRLVLPVRANDPDISVTRQITLAPGESFTLSSDIFAGLRSGTAHATLAMGPLARLDAPGLLAALTRYPYGCTEQITSRALPMLYLDGVAQATGQDAPLPHEDIAAAITAVLARQATNGAFGLWQAGAGDFWLDAYVSDFLSRARAAGHAVPEVAFRAALANLRNQLNYAAEEPGAGPAVAYALMVLAREGAAAVGDLRYYADARRDMFDTPLAAAQLGMALALYGDQPRADALFAHGAAQLQSWPEAQVWRTDYGTALRDTAGLLALALEAGSTAVDQPALVGRLADRPAHLSPQEAAWSLLAAHAAAGSAAVQGLTVDGAPAPGPVLALDPDAPDRVIRNTGAAPEVLTLTTFGTPEVPEPAGGNGYAITRRHYTLEGAEVALDTVAVGTRLVTVLEVTPFDGGGGRLMVSDPVPAGFEIDNPNLLRGGDVRALDWLDVLEEVRHSEAREDRFLAAVDWQSAERFRLAYIVRAVTPGQFHHPAPGVEDMYRPAFRAHGDTGRVIVTE